MEEGFATKAIHSGQSASQWNHCSVVPPLVMSTTFKQDGPAEHRVCMIKFHRHKITGQLVIEIKKKYQIYNKHHWT